MRQYKVVFSNGNTADIFADYDSVSKLEKSEQRTEYGRYKSYICTLEFYKRCSSDYDYPAAIFNPENIAGYYWVSDEQEREKE